MKWNKENRTYMFANYFSDDGKYKVWDKDVLETTKGKTTWKHKWFLQDLTTNDIVFVGKTLKACKEYAETH